MIPPATMERSALRRVVFAGIDRFQLHGEGQSVALRQEGALYGAN